MVNIPSRESPPKRNAILVFFTGATAYKEFLFKFSSISLGGSNVKEGKSNKCHSERSEESKRDSSPVRLRMINRVAKQSQEYV